MAQKGSKDQNKNVKMQSPAGSKGEIDKASQGTSEEKKLVNVVADKVLTESKKPKNRINFLTSLNDKLLSKIKLPAPLSKYLGQFKPLSYYFNTATDHGRANWSKTTYAAVALTFIYFKFIRKKSSDKQKITADPTKTEAKS